MTATPTMTFQHLAIHKATWLSSATPWPRNPLYNQECRKVHEENNAVRLRSNASNKGDVWLETSISQENVENGKTRMRENRDVQTESVTFSCKDN